MGSYEDKKVTGTVFNIQKYSVHDGPGIRTIVFTKGCPLACQWCSNPESQSTKPQVAYNEGRCIGVDKCGHCITACPQGAITANPDVPSGQPLTIDRTKCASCDTLDCAHACPSKGLIIYGDTMTVDKALQAVEKDAIFYSRSGGGMTMSGGEPLMDAKFAIPLLREARLRRIKTAIETCGCVPWETLKEAAGFLNFVLFDIKHMDSAKHKEGTGVGNELILENLKKLLTEFPDLPVLVRTPIIPDFNDTDENARAIGEFLKGHANVTYEALPYHRLGTQKYTFLGREYPLGDIKLEADVAPRFQKIVDDTRKA
ncbi:MAG: glycyl-radical enzyme activating protein [Bilophila sp.]